MTSDWLRSTEVFEQLAEQRLFAKILIAINQAKGRQLDWGTIDRALGVRRDEQGPDQAR